MFTSAILSPASIRRLLRNSLGYIFFNFFQHEFAIKFIKYNGRIEPKKRDRNPPDYTILDNWVFKNFVLDDEKFAKASGILEFGASLNNNYVEN